MELYQPPVPNSVNSILAMKLWFYRVYRFLSGKAEFRIIDENAPAELHIFFYVIDETAQRTITLPDSAVCKGKIFGFLRTPGGFNSQIVPISGDTIDGSASAVTITDGAGATVQACTMVISTGNGWIII